MHAAIERQYQVAIDRTMHYQQLADGAGTDGRRESAQRHAAYYLTIAKLLLAAVEASEYAP